jgi:hypothetical protein
VQVAVDAIDVDIDRPIQAVDFAEGLLGQHKMNHFLEAICKSDKALTHIETLRMHAFKAFGFNHDESAPDWITA